MRWQFIRTYLERDIPQLGPRVPAETLRRFWTMLLVCDSGLVQTLLGLGDADAVLGHPVAGL